MGKSSVRVIFLSISLGLFSACEKKSAASSDASAATRPNPAIPDSQPVPGQLVVTAELMEIPGSFPANDLYNYAYIMKYKILKVIKGVYADTEILVGHYNPSLARAEIKDERDSLVGGSVTSFQVGDVHYLVLSPLDEVWSGASEDDFIREKRARYWAFWADKIKSP